MAELAEILRQWGRDRGDNQRSVLMHRKNHASVEKPGGSSTVTVGDDWGERCVAITGGFSRDLRGELEKAGVKITECYMNRKGQSCCYQVDRKPSDR